MLHRLTLFIIKLHHLACNKIFHNLYYRYFFCGIKKYGARGLGNWLWDSTGIKSSGLNNASWTVTRIIEATDLCCDLHIHTSTVTFTSLRQFNPLNAELNPICHFLTLLGAHHIFHVSGIRVKAFPPFFAARYNKIRWNGKGKLLKFSILLMLWSKRHSKNNNKWCKSAQLLYYKR